MEGVFALPVTLVVEKIIPYRTEGSVKPDTGAMSQRLYESLEKSVDGEVLSHSAVSGSREGLEIVSLRASCLENIAELCEYKTP